MNAAHQQRKLFAWHQELSDVPYSYSEVGASRGAFPSGYDHDLHRFFLGSGRDLFEQAGALILQLRHFPPAWTRTAYTAPLQAGTLVGVAFRLLGRWWFNACRVVYLIREPNRLGFAYGTTRHHVERGEEIFEVTLEEEERVYFQIRAFSRPARWYTQLGYPVARRYQRKFARDAFAQMQSLLPKPSAL